MKELLKSEIEGFQFVCSLKDLQDNYGKRFLVDDEDIAVYKKDNKVYAMSNVCPHNLSALIYDGFIENKHVVCPVHGWMFNLETGRTPSGNGKLRIFETKIIDNDVYVKVIKREYNW